MKTLCDKGYVQITDGIIHRNGKEWPTSLLKNAPGEGTGPPKHVESKTIL